MGPVEMSNSEHRRPQPLVPTHISEPQRKIPHLADSETNTKSPATVMSNPITQNYRRKRQLARKSINPVQVRYNYESGMYRPRSDYEANMASQGVDVGEESSPEPEIRGDKTYRGLGNVKSGNVKSERAPSPILWFSPTPEASTEKIAYGWKHPTELEYITPADWSDTKIIHFLIANSFDVPHRGNVKGGSPFVNVTGANGKVTILPVGYRIPLMFLARFQWLSLKLVLTAASKEKEWQEYKFGILHVSRLCKALFDAAQEQSKFESDGKLKGMDRKWRCPTFDRALARYRLKWFLSTPAQLEEFWETYQEEEYDKDALKFDWRRWAIKGHRGFSLSEDEITNGITAEQFMKGLKWKDKNWYWETKEDPVSGGVEAWSLRYAAMGVASPSHDSSEPPVSDSLIRIPLVSTLPLTKDITIPHPSTVAPVSAITPDTSHSFTPTLSPSASLPIVTQSTVPVSLPSTQTSAPVSTAQLSAPAPKNTELPTAPASMSAKSSVSHISATGVPTLSAQVSSTLPATHSSMSTSGHSMIPMNTSTTSKSSVSTGCATGTSILGDKPSTTLLTSQSSVPRSGNTGQPAVLVTLPSKLSPIMPTSPVVSVDASNSAVPNHSTKSSAQNQATTSTISTVTTSTTSTSSPLIDRVKSQSLNSSDPHQKENKAADNNTMATTQRSATMSSQPFVELQKLIPRKRPGSPLEKGRPDGSVSGEKSVSVGNTVPTVPASTLDASVLPPSTDIPRLSTLAHTNTSSPITNYNKPASVTTIIPPVADPSIIVLENSQMAVSDRAVTNCPTTSTSETASSAMFLGLRSSATSSSDPALTRTSSAPPTTIAVQTATGTDSQSPPRTHTIVASSSRSSSSAPHHASSSAPPLAFSNITKEEAARLMGAKVWRPLVDELKSQVGSEEVGPEDSGAPEGWMDVDHTEDTTISKNGSVSSLTDTDPASLPSSAAIAATPPVPGGSTVDTASDTASASTSVLPFSPIPMLQPPTFRAPYVPQFYLNSNTRNYGVVPYHAAAGVIHTKPSPLSSLPLQALHQLAHKAGLQLASSTRTPSTEARTEINSGQQSENLARPVTPVSTPQAITQPETPTSTVDDISQADAASSGVSPDGVVKIIDSLFTGFAESLRKFSVELRQLKEEAVKEVGKEMKETVRDEIREGIKQELAEFSSTMLKAEIREAVRAELMEGPFKRDLREGNQADVKDGVRVVVATMREEVLRDMRRSFKDVKGDMNRLRDMERETAWGLDDIRGYMQHKLMNLEEVAREGMRRAEEHKETRSGSRKEKGKAVDFGYVRHPLHHLLGDPNPPPSADDDVEMPDDQTYNTGIISEWGPSPFLNDARHMARIIVESQQATDFENGGDYGQVSPAPHPQGASTGDDTVAPTGESSNPDNGLHQSPALPFYMENPSPMPVKSQRKFQKMALGRAGTSGTSTEGEATPGPEDLQQ